MDKFQEFYLQRNEDVSGTSGTGIVARGIVFPSGKAIHGHGGKTLVILGTPKVNKPRKKKE